MKKLNDILGQVKVTELIGDPEINITKIDFDSRMVGEGSLFVAVRGVHVDGHKFINSALQNVAVAVVCEEFPEDKPENITWVKVQNSSIALGQIASEYFGNPSGKLKLYGVTGTNGKTTVVCLLYQLFRHLGFKVGMLSTIGNRIDDIKIKSTHTTADAVQINSLLAEMVEHGCEYCFMEVSSHAIDQNRIAGLNFKGAVFTNISHDHLDYHLTFEKYIEVKKKFFDTLNQDSFALVNADDRNGKIMIQNTSAVKKTYGLKSLSNFRAKILEYGFEGMELRIDKKNVYCKLTGKFNAYNLLATFAIAILDGQDEDKVLLALSKLKPVEGRFQIVSSKSGVIAIVDYAHTPDALKNVLQTIVFLKKGNEQLITLIGAGGDRDKQKRPLLARIACTLSNKVILTSDNPRSEDPEKILDDMENGLVPVHKKKVIRITNRREAIKAACSFANSGDIILVAGKGHETYQEINEVRNHFDDKEILNEFL